MRRRRPVPRVRNEPPTVVTHDDAAGEGGARESATRGVRATDSNIR